jgi:hypothetical protein
MGRFRVSGFRVSNFGVQRSMFGVQLSTLKWSDVQGTGARTFLSVARVGKPVLLSPRITRRGQADA